MRSISDTEDFEYVIQDHPLVLVDFTASWCGPCKRIKPALEKMSQDYDKVFFCTVDVDECEELSKKYEISCMPTFMFFKNGQPVPQLTVSGANESEIRDSINGLVIYS